MWSVLFQEKSRSTPNNNVDLFYFKKNIIDIQERDYNNYIKK